MQVLERMITDALQIEQYDFASLVYVRVLLEIEAIKLCARNRTVEDLAVIEEALKECEEKFYTDERVSKDFAYHQALARGAHNPVIASLLLVITPDVLRYYQRYRVCSVPSEEVCFEHRELLRFCSGAGRGGRRGDASSSSEIVAGVCCDEQRRKSFSGIGRRLIERRACFAVQG